MTTKISVSGIQSSNDGVQMNKGPLKALRNLLRNRILKYKVCKFSSFFSGVECGLILSNVKCFIEA